MCDFLFCCCGVLLYVESVWPTNAAGTVETRPTRSLSDPRNYTCTLRHRVDRAGSIVMLYCCQY